MSLVTAPPATPKPTAAPPGAGKRLDIQGLRAIAVLAVLIDHVGVFALPGGFVGVDIFFVISGFLITGHLVKTYRAEGRIGFAEFFANRIRRLVPAATLVLLFVAATTRMFLPSTIWQNTYVDILASAGYVENWVLASRSVDYMTQDSLPSPLQHFWSLAVEEQFYLLWPIIIAAVGVCFTAVAHRIIGGRRRQQYLETHPGALRVSLLIGLAVIAVPSFLLSVSYTESHPAQAYFVTFTRLWELAIGGFLAIVTVHLLKVPAAVGSALMWVGLGGIGLSLTLINEQTPFPGVAAALPTLATACVIAGGFTANRAGPGFLLNLKPVQLVGDMSYSLYLWHWPFIVIAMAQFTEITPTIAVVLMVVSLAVAYLSYRWVEQPTRQAKFWVHESGPAFGGAAACIVVTALTALALVGHPASQRENEEIVAAAEAQWELREKASDGTAGVLFGAQVLPADPLGSAEGAPVDTFDRLIPAPGAAMRDTVGCRTAAVDETEVVACPFGNADSETKVALVGDSHAAQWLGALAPMAEEYDWNLTAYIHDSCPFADGDLIRGGRSYDSCMAWNEAVTIELLAQQDLSVVLTSNYTPSVSVDGGVEAMAAAHRAAWQPLLEEGTPLIVIRDTPEPRDVHIAECASLNSDELTACAFPRAAATENQGAAQMLAAQQSTGVTAVDLNDAICPTDPCAAAIGGVLIYRDTNHLTATYARSLEPRLAAALSQVPGLVTG